MDKTANAYRTISEVAAELDLPQHVLRFWETRFLQIKPLKRGGGRRYYRPDDIELLKAIKSLLYSEGYTIKGVQRILREQNLRKLLQASQEAREQGLPIVLLGPEPMDEAREDGASCLPAEDEHTLVDTMAGQEFLPLQEASDCSPHEILPAALPEDIRHTLELLSIELIECRKILNNSN